MAYGSTKSISDSILAATDGESIQEQIDAYMQSSASGTTGDGLIAAATINQDTDAAVSAMRKKSLGARESQAKAQKAVVNDKLASVGRDWLTLMQGDGQANASEISEKRSILLAEVEDIPTTELTDDQYFLRTGKKRPDYADDPDVFTKDGSDNISGSGASLAERSGGVMNFTAGDIDLSKFVVFDDSGDTGNGLMSSPRPKARPDNAPVVTSNRDPVKVAVDTTTTSSNVKKIQQALTTMGFKPNGVDGAMGGGTARALRKFQAANDLPITGKLTQEVADLLTNGTSITYPDRPVPFAVPEDIEDNLFDIFKVEVGYIESKNKYNIKGGSGNHYDGRYQMGEAAKKDAGRALGISLKHDAASRKAFREDSALQDKAFKAYTEMNHTHLTRNSEKYRNMSVEEKLGILGYAHNQGATAAEEYLFTGIVGTDANDTKGTRYTDAIAKALGN